MYKFRFSTWGLQKNLKHYQVAELLAQQNAAAANAKTRSTAIVIGGRQIDENRITTYLHRVSPARRRKIDAIAARSSSQKTAIVEESRESLEKKDTSRQAPLPIERSIAAKATSSRLDAPDILKLPEECVRIVQRWVHGAFDAGLWNTREDGRLVTPRHQSRWINQVSTAADLIDRGLVSQGFRLLGVCLDRYKKDVLRDGPMLFLNTYRAGVRLAARSPDLALFHSFLRFAHDLASVVYPPAHPLRLLLLRLRVSGTAGIRQLARVLLDAYLDAIQTHVHPDDGFLVVQSVAFLGNFNWAGHVAPAIERGFRGLKRLEAQMHQAQAPEREGKSASAAAAAAIDVIHPIKLSLAEALHNSGRYAEAKALVLEVLRAPAPAPGNAPGTTAPTCGHRTLSVYDFLLRDLRREGRHAEAVALAEEALRFCRDHLGPHHWRTARTRVALSAAHERAGDPAAAAAALVGFDEEWERVCRRRPGAYACRCGHRDEDEDEDEDGRGEGEGEQGKRGSGGGRGGGDLLGAFSARPLELRPPNPDAILTLDMGVADVLKEHDDEHDDGDDVRGGSGGGDDDNVGSEPVIKSEEQYRDFQNLLCSEPIAPGFAACRQAETLVTSYHGF
ncbi:hypothetical protein SLS62_002726 [Diatrype stigma]|uniref:Uncharacterized protein n=1 Tax=Diatrype stigma TaxID=117547 RepID=A0AAN9UX67_9PEZI